MLSRRRRIRDLSPVGDHRRNPKAIARAEEPGFVPPPPGAEVYGFQQQTALVLNAETMKEIVAVGKAAKEAGEDQRRAVHEFTKDFSPMANPEKYDIVVFNVLTLGRPSALAIDQNNIPTAIVRHSEFLRMPLTALQAEANKLFAKAAHGDQEPS